MSPAPDFDPAGERHALPTYPWGWARICDPDLATRTQLAQMGLRPGGQEPAAELRWRSRRATRNGGVRTALLYRISRAKPKRPMTPAKARALARALRARRYCPTCRRHYRYCMPTSLGQCPNCEYRTDPEPWELEDRHVETQEHQAQPARRAAAEPV